jgi:hypothetical protein
VVGSGVIRVRGNTSIRSGNGPLIVVDGVALMEKLTARSFCRPIEFINKTI